MKTASKNFRGLSISLPFVLLLISFGCGGGGSTAPEPRYNLTGLWYGKVTVIDPESGRLLWRDEGPVAISQSGTSVAMNGAEGQLMGNRLILTTKTPEMTVVWEGTILNNDHIEFSSLAGNMTLRRKV